VRVVTVPVEGELRPTALGGQPGGRAHAAGEGGVAVGGVTGDGLGDGVEGLARGRAEDEHARHDVVTHHREVGQLAVQVLADLLGVDALDVRPRGDRGPVLVHPLVHGGEGVDELVIGQGGAGDHARVRGEGFEPLDRGGVG